MAADLLPTTPQQAAWRRLLWAALWLTLLPLAALLWLHRADLAAYRHHLLDGAPVVSPRFEGLSRTMNEAALRKHFGATVFQCVEASRPPGRHGDGGGSSATDPTAGIGAADAAVADADADAAAPGDRVCIGAISRVDDLPALQLAARFGRGELLEVAFALPWWAHHAAVRQQVARLGAPVSMDTATAARPMVRWRLPGGWIEQDRNPGYDPLKASLLRWRADASTGDVGDVGVAPLR
jgi:hypothetical protein